MSDEQQIRDLIERWATAVHTGDLATVLAEHAAEIVMFDVPPPDEGVRGIDAYRAVWPSFFAWQAAGAVFALESLDVTAGPEVAFAFALLRCGAPEDFAAAPERRLRLTLGLVKRDGRWTVTHEHHSFPDASYAEAVAAETAVRAIHQAWFAQTAAKDLDGMMAHIADDVVSYEHQAPLQYAGVDAVREVCRQGLEQATGAVTWEMPALTIHAAGDLAVAWGLNRMTAARPNGEDVTSWSRGTRVFRRRGADWEMIHQHVSFPLDRETGAARSDLTP